MQKVMEAEAVDAVMHLAAESHVDRSIDGPGEFIQTNIMGTFALLQAARSYHAALPEPRKSAFRFHHISTDEVFGDLPLEGGLFTEETSYAPSSPYSASKAASDHLVMAWHHTYGLPVVLSNCSNNYGPYHFPEKLIPLMILNGMEGKKLPVYGTGRERSRLAACGRPCPCAGARGHEGPGGPVLQYRRPQRTLQPESR